MPQASRAADGTTMPADFSDTHACMHALPPSPTPEPPALVLMIFEVVSVSLLDG